MLIQKKGQVKGKWSNLSEEEQKEILTRAKSDPVFATKLVDAAQNGDVSALAAIMDLDNIIVVSNWASPESTRLFPREDKQ